MVLAVSLLMPGGSGALASVGVSVSLTTPATVTVGQQNVAVTITIINTNTPPNSAENNILTLTSFAGSCGAAGTVSNACPVPDPGVLALAATGTGRAGTAAAGKNFTISAPDASGAVTLTPSSPVVLGPPGTAGGGDRCIIDFTASVTRSPSIDTSPGTPGNQTRQNLVARVQGQTSSLTVSAQVSILTTVLRAAPTLNHSASPNIELGVSVSDTVTLSGAVNPTGTVTFTLFGPDNSACSGSPVFTITNPVNAGGTATSSSFTPVAPGTYRWVASYSGDANHLSVGGVCNMTRSLVTVEVLRILSIFRSGTNVTVVGKGVAGRSYRMQHGITLGGWTTAAGTLVADGSGLFTYNESSSAPGKFYRAKVP